MFIYKVSKPVRSPDDAFSVCIVIAESHARARQMVALVATLALRGHTCNRDSVICWPPTLALPDRRTWVKTLLYGLLYNLDTSTIARRLGSSVEEVEAVQEALIEASRNPTCGPIVPAASLRVTQLGESDLSECHVLTNGHIILSPQEAVGE